MTDAQKLLIVSKALCKVRAFLGDLPFSVEDFMDSDERVIYNVAASISDDESRGKKWVESAFDPEFYGLEPDWKESLGLTD